MMGRRVPSTLEITDAKPLTDGEQPDGLCLVIDEVLIQMQGDRWVSLDLAQTPFEIILLVVFYDNPIQWNCGHIPANQVQSFRFFER